jgi:serine acetyltransferase
MLDFLRAYKNYDPAAKSIVEIALLYPGPKAVLLHRVAHCFYQAKFLVFSRALKFIPEHVLAKGWSSITAWVL